MLTGAIKAQGAEVDTVLPYVYDAKAADANIVTAIDEMAEGRIDAIALTNLGQIRRLIEAARAHGCEDTIARRTRADADRFRRARRYPMNSSARPAHRHPPAEDAFFMRPLISAMAAALVDKRPKVAE